MDDPSKSLRISKDVLLTFKSDEQLAQDQACQANKTTNAILIEQEWHKRRLIKQHELNLAILEKQNAFNRELAKYSARIGFYGVIVGAILTAIVSAIVTILLLHYQQSAPRSPLVSPAQLSASAKISLPGQQKP